MVTIKFKGVLILKHDTERRFSRALSSTQQAFLQALGLNETIFLHPQKAALWPLSPPLIDDG